MYSNSNHWIFALESDPVLLQSQQGVHQGDPLGPALFAIDIQNILCKIQARHADVKIIHLSGQCLYLRSTIAVFGNLQ